jgi:glucosamine--fructose-6-phosphate aminotransferase (isomerizing)
MMVEDYAYYLSSVAIASIAFYLAYYVALAKGLNVDKPRNLAKSVTVE